MATGTISFHTDLDKVQMRNEIRQQIVGKLRDKEYRDIFVSEQINTGLAFQIRAMREQRGWSQAKLGLQTEMAQSRISVMEDANYSRFSLNTLKRLASAFDVALVVRFEPFSKLVEHFVALDSASLNIPDFGNDSFSSDILHGDFNSMPLNQGEYVIENLTTSLELQGYFEESEVFKIKTNYILSGFSTTSFDVSVPTPIEPIHNVVVH